MAETAILVGFLVMALAAIFGAFPKALDNFNFECLKVIAVPVL